MSLEGTLCTICARGGSQGVKNKNIKILLGKPLIAHSILSARESGLFDHIVVSTDSDAIAEVSLGYGAEVFFKRPEELSSNTAAKIPVIRHALIESERFYGTKFAVLVDLDATSPLRTSEDIREAFSFFKEHSFDNVITAMPARKSPYFNMVEQTEDGKASLSKKLDKNIVRRQDAPKCYDMNASIYIWTRESLMLQDAVVGDNTGLYIMPEERSVDIDTELDFDFVEFLAAKGRI
jgi:CMP-N,N'-diacetyllegionaminic acid synthase